MQIASMTSQYFNQRNSKEKTTVLESMRRLKAAGFEHLDLNMCPMGRGEGELCGTDWKERAAEIRKYAKDNGIVFLQSHAPYHSKNPANLEPAEFERMSLRSLEINAMLEIPYAVLHPVMNEQAAPEDIQAHIQATLEAHKNVLCRAKELGVRPVFENMIGSREAVRFCKGAEDLIALCEAAKDADPGICWDFGHANLSHADQRVEIRKLKNRILCVHTHDNKGVLDDHAMPFIGNIPWETVLPVLREAGFQSDLVLEVAMNSALPDCLRDEATRLCANASRLLIEMFESK